MENITKVRGLDFSFLLPFWSMINTALYFYYIFLFTSQIKLDFRKFLTHLQLCLSIAERGKDMWMQLIYCEAKHKHKSFILLMKQAIPI